MIFSIFAKVISAECHSLQEKVLVVRKEEMIIFLTDLEGHYHVLPTQDERHAMSAQIKMLIESLKPKVEEANGKTSIVYM